MKKKCLVCVEEIHKKFKEVHALKGVNLFVSKGEFIAILGPNGAGKTTLVEIIEGIQRPDRGTVQIKGLNWKNHSKEIHRLLGLSLQETRFFERITVRETLQLFASFLCERIIMMNNGTIIKDGSFKQLLIESGKANLDELFIHLTGRGLSDETVSKTY